MGKDEKYRKIVDDFWGEGSEPEKKENASTDEKKENDKAAGLPDLSSLEEMMKDITNIKEDVKAQEEKERSDQGVVTEQNAEEKKEEPEEDPMETLNNLVGLSAIKNDVKELVNLLKVRKMREENGLKTVPVSLHLVFTGNPGTGKTTVARILAKLYKQIGVLKKGQLVEVDRSGLVAGFVGQTATKTQEKITEAMGGILFIDEAYTLVKEGGNDFGQEAIDTILKAMEDHRDELIVIVAGYTGPMEKFIHSNPGLKSRFNKYLNFEDYTVEELQQIFDGNCKKYDYVLSEEADQVVKECIEQMVEEKGDNFANARSIRNFFENIITNQATRLAEMENLQPEDMRIIQPEDIDRTAI